MREDWLGRPCELCGSPGHPLVDSVPWANFPATLSLRASRPLTQARWTTLGHRGQAQMGPWESLAKPTAPPPPPHCPLSLLPAIAPLPPYHCSLRSPHCPPITAPRDRPTAPLSLLPVIAPLPPITAPRDRPTAPHHCSPRSGRLTRGHLSQTPPAGAQAPARPAPRAAGAWRAVSARQRWRVARAGAQSHLLSWNCRQH